MISVLANASPTWALGCAPGAHLGFPKEFAIPPPLVISSLQILSIIDVNELLQLLMWFIDPSVVGSIATISLIQLTVIAVACKLLAIITIQRNSLHHCCNMVECNSCLYRARL